MKKGVILIASLFRFLLCMAGDGDWAVSKISPALLKSADAVLRMEDIRFEIVSLKETVLKQHVVITVLNENGGDWAGFSEYYDKLRELTAVEGFLYDANGKLLKKMKFKDLQDLSGVEDISLIDDNRIKKHNFYYKVYPYTVEYESEVRYKHTFYFPMWTPQGGQKLSVEKSQISMVCPSDYQFRYKAFNYASPPVTAVEKNKKISTWMAKDLPAITRERFGPAWHDLTTVVIFGPTDFQLGDYKGNMDNWANLGRFQYGLNQGRDQLPASIKQKVHELTNGITDVKTRIRILYEYLQKNTRYISIQLGIGGWQPFDANSVALKGYGDCKALSNYMCSLLKEAGIRSLYAEIRAGANEKYITDDFPSVQFNHIIVCVPLGKDSVWLECTSQTLPAGYLSDFTSDRYAFLVDENGGKLARTPKYGWKENLQVRHIRAKLDGEGSLEIRADSKYEAEQQDDLHNVINYLTKDKVKEYLHDHFDFSTYTITSFEYKESKTDLPLVDEQLGIAVSSYATITGRRLFINPNIMTKSRTLLTEDGERKSEIVLDNEYTDIDSVEIELPPGYGPESIPQDVNLSDKFGKYSSSLKLTGDKLLYCRRMEQYSGRFPASGYADLVRFFGAIYKADHARVVLVKKE